MKKIPLADMLSTLASCGATNLESAKPTRIVLSTLLGTVFLFSIEKIEDEGDPDRSELDMDIDEVEAEASGASCLQIDIALTRRELRDLPKRTSRAKRAELEKELADAIALRDAPFRGRRRKHYLATGAMKTLIRQGSSPLVQWRVWDLGRGRWGITHVTSEMTSQEITPIESAAIEQRRKLELPGLEDRRAWMAFEEPKRRAGPRPVSAKRGV